MNNQYMVICVKRSRIFIVIKHNNRVNVEAIVMARIETERLYLRSLNVSDADRVEELASVYDVAKTTLNIPHPYPKDSAKEFIERVNADEENGEIVSFAVIKKDSDSLIGIINIKLSPSHKRGELGYWIGKPYWGEGYCTEAARALLPFGFADLDLNKIIAAALTSNPGSWRVMEKIGLTYEGTLKQHVYRFDKFFDLVTYGLLKEEFLKGT